MTPCENTTNNKLSIWAIAFGVLISFTACFSNEKEYGHNSTIQIFSDSIEDSAIEEVPVVEPLVIKYRSDTLLRDKANFQNIYSDNQKEIVLALNRISESQLRTGRIFVVPDTFLTDLIHYSPFPNTLPDTLQLDKLIIVSKRIQAFALYENGSLIRWGPVSTGKKSTPTPSRLYHTNFKALRKISTINSSWIMPYYYNIDNWQGIALHEYVLPGYPASHACIRLFKKDAVFIYNWAEGWTLHNRSGRLIKYGTPVVVFGDYDYKGVPPWRKLAENEHETTLTHEDIKGMLSYLSL